MAIKIDLAASGSSFLRRGYSWTRPANVRPGTRAEGRPAPREVNYRRVLPGLSWHSARPPNERR
jgi:hypothetical protein